MKILQTNLRKMVAAGMAALLLSTGANATIIYLDFADDFTKYVGTDTKPDEPFLYKAEAPGTDPAMEEGDLKDYYDAAWTGSLNLTISHSGDVLISDATLWIKAATDYYYVDLGPTGLNWDGWMDIVITDIDDVQNNISHASLTGSRVPDGGTTVALFGLSLLGLGGVRRLSRSRKA